MRVDLPKPNCAVCPSDCEDIDVLNDARRLQRPAADLDPLHAARSTRPASTSDNDLPRPAVRRRRHRDQPGRLGSRGEHAPRRVRPAARPAHDAICSSSRTGVRDAAGDPIEPARFLQRPELRPDQGSRRQGLPQGARSRPSTTRSPPASRKADVAAASLFTTQSVTAAARAGAAPDQGVDPGARDFTLGTAGERTVFPLAERHGRSCSPARRTTAPASPAPCTPLPALGVLGLFGSVGTIAFGAYDSPDYETAGEGDSGGRQPHRRPAVQGTNRIHFNLFLPPAPRRRAAGRWRSSATASATTRTRARSSSPRRWRRRGIATIAINVVGHGGGPLGTLTVIADGGRPGDALRRRPWDRPERRTARSTRPRASTRRRRRRSSAAGTASARR